MFGLTFEKLLLIGVIAVFVLGPERLPGYAAKLAQLVRTVRNMANGAKDRMKDEMGPDFEDVDWKKLDPRQYDPRRIIREALLDDEPGPASAVRPISRPETRPEPAYLQKKAKSAGGPVPVEGAVGAGVAGAGAAAGAVGAVGAVGAAGAAGGAAASVLGADGHPVEVGASAVDDVTTDAVGATYEPVTVPPTAAYDSEAT